MRELSHNRSVVSRKWPNYNGRSIDRPMDDRSKEAKGWSGLLLKETRKVLKERSEESWSHSQADPWSTLERPKRFRGFTRNDLKQWLPQPNKLTAKRSLKTAVLG